MKMYTVIYCSEDGDHSIDVISERELNNRLSEGHYGEMKFFNKDEFKNRLGLSLNLNEFCGLIIIPGAPIVPKPKQVVTEYELEPDDYSGM